MTEYLGDFPVNGVVYLPWDTFAAAGESATYTGGTLKLYKGHATQGTWETQRTSLAGVTDITSFDGITGRQATRIDLSDNTDAGFYVAGGEYQVAKDAMTIDGKTVNKWLCTFSIERTGGVLALLKSATFGLAVTKTAVDDIPTNAELATALAAADDATLAAIAALNNLSAAQVWALASVIDGKTPAEALKIIAAAVAGGRTGAGTGTETFKGLDTTTTRLTGDVDASGNRSSVTYP